MSDNFPRPDGYNQPVHPTPPPPTYYTQPVNGAQPPTPVTNTQEPIYMSSRPKTNWLKVLARYAAIWIAILLMVKFVVPSYEVKGSSMVPTYQPAGDRVLTDGVFFKLMGGPERGDIVILDRAATNGAGDEALIKRVIGLPGERLEVRQGSVYINNKLLNEPYIKNHGGYNYPSTVLGSECYFVLGDNRPVSLDSHYFGCITRDQIVAKVLLTYPWRF
jgi:signal peptidase I